MRQRSRPATGRGGRLPARHVDTAARERARTLVETSAEDPLAPFVLRADKQYAFSPDGRAVIGYRTWLGLVVAAGDPVGDRRSWPAAVDQLMETGRLRRQGVAVLGAGDAARELWAAHGLSAVAIGRDVVVRPEHFGLVGRRYRNLRQAVRRTHNAGVTVEHWSEANVPRDTLAELRWLLAVGGRDRSRGFSMLLGTAFDGGTPDSRVVLARDRAGRVVGAHRYLRAGPKDLTLDVPIRHPEAPNGVDERLVAEMVDWAARHGMARVSLAFAPFPDLFGPHGRDTWGRRAAYVAVHAFDPLIRVERLYRYLRKFHAFAGPRYVMLRRRQVVRAAAAMLLLEFF